MELKRRISLKYIFIGAYILAFLAFLVYGLQPAEAAQSEQISGKLEIPSIGLVSDVTTLELQEGRLVTPDSIVGSFSNHENKILLIGHSTTVFQNLKDINLGDTISFNGSNYQVVDIQILEKQVVNMHDILAGEDEETLTIMTCAGDLLDGGDATHRLIVEAK